MIAPGTETIAFGLRLRPGCEAEYQRRHDELWPEMRDALRDAGILHYEIHLCRPENILFAFLQRRTDHTMDHLRETEIFRRWQTHMADILIQDTNGPLRLPLEHMFTLQ
jgi:L-rhamnose mutarotase